MIACAATLAAAAGTWTLYDWQLPQTPNTSALGSIVKTTAATGQQSSAADRRARAGALPGKPRLQTSDLLPPTGTPLKDVYDTLKSRADAGDVEAASRLYTDLFHCVSARASIAAEPIVLNHALNEDLSKLGQNELQQRENFLAAMSERLQAARRDVAVCDGLSETQLQVTPVLLRAAQLADPVAANCYVAGFPDIAKGLLSHPEWVTQYRDNGLAIAEMAVAHGDWSMVAQLQQAYAQTNPFGLLGELTGADPVQSYRYLRLQRLGASERLGPQLDAEIAAAEGALSPADIEAAAAWAEATYRRYFSAHPERRAVREPNLCPE